MDKPSDDRDPENPLPFPYSLFDTDVTQMSIEELSQYLLKRLDEIHKNKALSEQKSSLPDTSSKKALTIGESSGTNPEQPRRLIDFLEDERDEEASVKNPPTSSSAVTISGRESSQEETSESRKAKENYQQSKREGKRIVGFEENKTDMPDDNVRFIMRVQPAKILKNAVSALCDLKFNPSGMGMIEVGKAGFEITVNIEGEDLEIVSGFLRLKAVGLTVFHCPKPLRSMVSLDYMNTILNRVDTEEDCVTVIHVYGTNVLSFEINSPVSDKALGEVEFPGYVTECKFPNVTYGFGDIMKSTDLLSMINETKRLPVKKQPQLVSVTVGTNWIIRVDELNVEKPGKNIKAWIAWPYWESLEKALRVADGCRLCLVTEPKDCIMLRFEILGLGDLVYLVKAYYDDPRLPCLGYFSSFI